MNHGRLVLRRLRPPFRRTVLVPQVTPQRFQAIVAEAYMHAAVARNDADLRGVKVDEESIRKLLATETAVCRLADLLVPDEPRGWFSAWLPSGVVSAFCGPWGKRRDRLAARRNILGLLAASREAEGDGGWTRMRSLVNLGGSAPERSDSTGEHGGIWADIGDLCRAFPGLDPMKVWREWTMLDLMDACQAVNVASAQHRKEQERRAAEATSFIDPKQAATGHVVPTIE